MLENKLNAIAESVNIALLQYDNGVAQPPVAQYLKARTSSWLNIINVVVIFIFFYS